MKTFLLFYSVILTFISAQSATAQSTLAHQEKCAEAANAFVLNLDSVASYNCHYSKKLDGCFLRAGFYLGSTSEEIKWFDGKVTKIKHPHTEQSLYNVFDNKVIGNFELIGTKVLDCWVADSKCETIDEFENMLKIYLEE